MSSNCSFAPTEHSSALIEGNRLDSIGPHLSQSHILCEPLNLF
ncbi:MAG: hypothetical protein ON057_000377 [Glomeribacter sp. 1016415]|nr:hypothetical protein [Glomeribacter sp. 1016415]